MTPYENQLAVVQAELEKLHHIQMEARGDDKDIGLVTGFVAVTATSIFIDHNQAFGHYWSASMGLSVPHCVGLLDHGKRMMLRDAGYGKCDHDA